MLREIDREAPEAGKNDVRDAEASALCKLVETDRRTRDREVEPIFAGFGRCKSCNCSGYQKRSWGVCKCGHHYMQHEGGA